MKYLKETIVFFKKKKKAEFLPLKIASTAMILAENWFDNHYLHLRRNETSLWVIWSMGVSEALSLLCSLSSPAPPVSQKRGGN